MEMSRAGLIVGRIKAGEELENMICDVLMMFHLRMGNQSRIS
jgi:hypothetical protein